MIEFVFDADFAFVWVKMVRDGIRLHQSRLEWIAAKEEKRVFEISKKSKFSMTSTHMLKTLPVLK